MTSIGVCPSENELLELLSGSLAAERLTALEQHLDGCAVCCEALSSIASRDPQRRARRRRADASATLARGTSIGRYLVVDVLGKGGMGIVYAAYDPELDRRVALKLLADPAPSRDPLAVAELHERLRREAQAMARLSHPNVVTVFDVGEASGQLFVAMELVAGATLASWLGAAPRTVDQIIAQFVAAGRGLEAAHAAGFVHRDFKPANVLVGDDGRVCVTDFGLARLVGDPAPLDAASPAEALSGAASAGAASAGAESSPVVAALTQTGMLLGTPRYMAPEQLEGRAADARSDQFSFCVALYEALYGQRPFPGSTVEELKPAIRSGPVVEPARGRKVPLWLRRVLLRGLRVVPVERYPSMSVLLRDLGRNPAARRRGIAIIVAALALLIGAGAGVVAVGRGRRATCERAGEPIAAVWNDGVRARLGDVFRQSGSLAAGDELERVGAALTAYARAFRAMGEEACRASRVDGRQSDTLYDLRMSCLDERRRTTEALLSQWQSGMSAEAVQRATQSVAELPSLDACADAAALTAVTPLPRDAGTRARIVTVRDTIARARAFEAAANLSAARAAAERANTDAARVAWPEVQAEAQLELAMVLDRFNDPGTTVPHFMEATRLGTLAHDDELAARAFVALVLHRSAAIDKGTPSKMHEVLALADAAEVFIARAGERPTLRGRLQLARGRAYLWLHRYADAEGALLAGQPLLVSEGALHDDNIHLYTMLSYVDLEWGHLDDAEKWAQKGMAAQIEASGPNHPRVSDAMDSLANVYAERGEYRRSRALYEEALPLAEKIYGRDTIHSAVVMNNLCSLDAAEGAQLAQGAALCEKAIALGFPVPTSGSLSDIRRLQGHVDVAEKLVRREMEIENQGGSADGPYWRTLLSLALTLQVRGDFAGAEATLAGVLATLTKNGNPSTAVVVQLAQADLLRARGRCREATAAYQQLLPELTKLRRPEQEEGRALLGMGLCAVDESQFVAALAPLVRALAIFDANEMPLRARGEARFALARAQAATGAAAAHDNGARAVVELTASEEAAAAALLPTARAWLRQH
jgi:tetratricopeptide (TPR) repeat protein